MEEADQPNSLEKTSELAVAKKDEEDNRREKALSERSDTRKNENMEIRPQQGEGKAVPPQAPARQRSNSSLAPAKTRAAHEGSTGHMIVETETVSSIPQTAISSTADRGNSQGGSLRLKPSTETIRPKKEKKKTVKKPPSIISTAGKTRP